MLFVLYLPEDLDWRYNTGYLDRGTGKFEVSEKLRRCLLML
jgi:hypothetical protein